MSRGRLLALGLLLVAATGVGSTGVLLERMSGERRAGARLLYLPNGKHLKLASLGQASLVADALFLWAIQYYSDYEREDRYRYVEHVFGNVIAELDPHYIDAYWLGALILIVEARDLDGGLRLLDLGFANNPDKWILPYLAAWECSHAGQYDRAAAYFRVAAAVEGAPPSFARIEAAMIGKGGDLTASIEAWDAIRESPDSDPESVAIAERKVRTLTVQLHLQVLSRAVDRFRSENGRLPAQLEELVQRDYISFVPRDPDERDYIYDPATGRIASATRMLGDT